MKLFVESQVLMGTRLSTAATWISADPADQGSLSLSEFRLRQLEEQRVDPVARARDRARDVIHAHNIESGPLQMERGGGELPQMSQFASMVQKPSPADPACVAERWEIGRRSFGKAEQAADQVLQAVDAVDLFSNLLRHHLRDVASGDRLAEIEEALGYVIGAAYSLGDLDATLANMTEYVHGLKKTAQIIIKDFAELSDDNRVKQLLSTNAHAYSTAETYNAAMDIAIQQRNQFPHISDAKIARAIKDALRDLAVTERTLTSWIQEWVHMGVLSKKQRRSRRTSPIAPI